MANKKAVIVEENQEDVLFHPKVIAQSVNDLKAETRAGFLEIKNELHAQRMDYATNTALIEAKRESKLQHDLLAAEIETAKRDARRANHTIARVGWIVFYIVIAAVLGTILYTNVGGHHG